MRILGQRYVMEGGGSKLMQLIEVRIRRFIAICASVCLVALVVSCGQRSTDQTSGESVLNRTMSSGTTDCEQLVDANTYTQVLDSTVADGSTLREWYLTRENGAYSPTQTDRVIGDPEITVCEFLSPGLKPPGPPGGSAVTANDPQTSIVLVGVGVNGEELLDSVGSQSSVDALFQKLLVLQGTPTPTETSPTPTENSPPES